ncbi:hypothetical protein SAY86_015538 [Trapa natans]|uniref:Nudix hydrolase domain-containing protein n=1 Tax=Trapa natans TaxID=22666 RepID=A0AAN7L8R6_TRANT|nr:hypothetical protein SAY86_015538 [Trapa natans]
MRRLVSSKALLPLAISCRSSVWPPRRGRPVPFLCRLGSSHGTDSRDVTAPAPALPLLARDVYMSSASVAKQEPDASEIQQIQVLDAIEDSHGGVIVEMNETMDSDSFSTLLQDSLSVWRRLGKRGVWIKLPIENANLIVTAVEAGFRYHHAEPNYLMLVCWLPRTTDTLPANASHRVSIGAFVMNDKRELLVVQENSGKFKGKGLWKLPTGVANEGEDIHLAAIREVKEETGIDTEFVEILAIRQIHDSFFTKSDLFFVCLLQPRSSYIQKQHLEIEAAQVIYSNVWLIKLRFRHV